MADTPATGAPAPTGETATPASISNDVSTASAPVSDNTSSAEVERLRKELTQKDMRINQLLNDQSDKNKADEAAKRKQMEDKEEFMALAERLEAQLKERDERDSEKERQATLQTATQDVLKEYPQAVQELATTAGLSLTDDSEEAKKAFVEKLDAFKAKVAPTAQGAGSNNVHNPAPADFDRQAIVRRESLNEPSVMGIEAVKGNLKPTYDYISSLPSIQRMKEIARGQ